MSAQKLRAKCPLCEQVCKAISSWSTNNMLKPNQVMHQFRCPRCGHRFRKATNEGIEVWE